MQQLRDTALQLMDLNQQISHDFSTYQNNRQLFCRQGCGACCQHPDIETSALEMLPWALHLYDSGAAESALESLQQPSAEGCFFYRAEAGNPQNGYCSIYPYRPALCRMFGAAGYRGRSGEMLLSVCKVIRNDRAEAVLATEQSLSSEPPPMMLQYKSQIAQLSYDLGNKNMPIKEAAKAALEKVLTKAYYSELA
jgi:Fe-S-cluster containining protein